MFIAAVTFADLQDNKRLYHAGETFPRDGLAVSDERINELAGSNNRMGFPLIIRQVEKAVETPVEGVSDEGNKSIRAEQKTPRKPRRKRESDA